MKRKKYLITVLFLALMIFMTIIGFIRFIAWNNSQENAYKDEIRKCLDLNNKYENDNQKIYCQSLINSNASKKMNFFDVMNEIDDFIPLSSNFFIIMLIIGSSSYYLSKYLKNNIIINDLTRENYNKIKKKLFSNARCSALVVPIVMLFKILITYIITKNFHYTIGNTMWEISNLSNLLEFFTVYILIGLFDSLIYVNISIIVLRKEHNLIVSTVLSYLTVIGIELFLEVVINSFLCSKILKTDFGVVFNIINFGCFNDSYGLFAPLLVSIILFIITWFITKIIYKNKEALLIDCEKDN